ncbi:MAG TPA: phosphate ABC transporter substrate-binding protein [Clostridia bacterium]|nr:phosphate ABC transporter substrate-binding protein [Clostridia bacterium]
MKNTRIPRTLALLAATALASASALAGSITIKGSDTLVILAQKWAETYMSQHPEIKIQVTGGGSGIGFAALQNNNTDIANASRPIKPAERAACIKAFNKNPREYKVALDGLSVYVHVANPINELSLDQLRDIFTGKIRNWKALGGNDAPITVYSRENSSGTYEFFKDHVLKGQDFLASAQTMPGTAAVLQSVVKTPNGIGYGGAAYGHDAKTLKIKKTADSQAVEPTEQTVVSGAYPISRYLFNYLSPEKDKGEIAAYLNWVRSDEGQKIVKDVGYYPLPSNLRQK